MFPFSDMAQSYFGYLTYLNERTMKRWDHAAAEIDERKYGSDKLLSDVLGFWGDAMEGWGALASGQGLPRVVFRLGVLTESDCKEIRVFGPAKPAGDPEVLFLRHLSGDADPRITMDRCLPCFTGNGRRLRIQLQGLLEPPDGQREPNEDDPLKEGVFEGLIQVGDTPLALIYIQISKKAAPGTSSYGKNPCP